MSKITKLAALAMLVFAVNAFATAHLNVTFLDSEGGTVYTFDKVIISDGEQVQVFENVTNISAEVPEDFTLTTVYHVGSHYNSFEIPLTLTPGLNLSLEIYAVDPNTVLGRVRPYLVGKEVGTTVDLTWSYSDPDATLTYWVQTSPPERYAFTATWVYAATDFNPTLCYTASNSLIDSHFQVARKFEHNDRIVSYWWCINVADWFRYEGPYADLYVNTTDIIQDHRGAARDRVRIAFSEVPENLIGLGIRRANHNYARVIKNYVLTLRNLNGQTYPPENFYPQWQVPPQTHYILGITGMPADYVALEYPLFVPDTVHSIVSDLYPPKLAELVQDTFFVAAENFYANSSYENLVRVPGVSMSVDVATEMAYDWWGCFVISDAYTVGSLYAEPNHVQLQEDYDYLINPAQGYNLVTVRTAPTYERLVLEYAPVVKASVKENVPGLEIVLDPSDKTTQIRYNLPHNCFVRIAVYSLDGRKIKSLVEEEKAAGTYTLYWNESELSSGVYICRLSADGIQAAEKMVRVK